MKLDPARQTFIAEARDLLRSMEQALLHLESEPDNSDAINTVFGAVHTIKGSTGVFGFDAIVNFAHVLETLLDCVRDRTIAVDKDLIALLLSSGDHIAVLVDQAARGKVDPSTAITSAVLIERLHGYLRLTHTNDPADELKPIDDLAAISVSAGQEAYVGKKAVGDTWHISVRFGRDVLRNGMDPLSVIRYLCTLGQIVGMTTLVDAIPPVEEMDPESCYLGVEIDFKGDVDKQAIEDAFAFLRDDCVIRILPQHTPIADRISDSTFIRVPANKLDQLINLVGELVITGAGTKTLAQRLGDDDLLETVSTMGRLVEEIRDGVLQLRMVQIGEIFGRFARVVRDTSHDLGKEVELLMSGAETELDKSIVDKIGDPLMHLVRNAIDHGIESGQLRQERGKPAKGTIHLNAYHDSGSIVIEVADDGGGMDKDKVYRKALDMGLVSAGQTLSDDDLFKLVFEPGFSTAEQLTNLSGRGVGMDVVRRKVEALRGSIEIDSRQGIGTTIRIRLPLTLAIIDGLLVGVANTTWVIPLSMVVECLDLPNVDRQFAKQRNFMNFRRQILPFLRLRDEFGIKGAISPRESVVVVRCGEQKAGLVVDKLLGEFQTVIKPLGQIFRSLKGISGSTILGSGDVALILDIPALIQQAREREERVSVRGSVDRGAW